ncbi:unnamed protein product [Amoebophrya sp. A25]|nr:unnamed protein product [Amoebophrya sp. A25]|eukprot:GSA25T00024563001.1
MHIRACEKSADGQRFLGCARGLTAREIAQIGASASAAASVSVEEGEENTKVPHHVRGATRIIPVEEMRKKNNTKIGGPWLELPLWLLRILSYVNGEIRDLLQFEGFDQISVDTENVQQVLGMKTFRDPALAVFKMALSMRKWGRM